MRKGFLLFLLFSVPTLHSFSQEYSEDEKQNQPLFLRFNILGLLDGFDNNLSFGIEKKFTRKVSFAFDAGWVFHSGYLSMSKKTSGIILRPSVRLYPNPDRNGFMEVELHYKSVLYTLEDWVGRECTNDVPAYDEFTSFRYRKQAYGFHLRGGYKGAFDREKLFWIEFSGGLGLRWKTQGLHREPESCYNRNGGLFELDAVENQARPVFPITVRLLYRIQ